MSLPNIFEPEIIEKLVLRIEKLSPQTPAQWGKMNVAQMLAHCSVPYDQLNGSIQSQTPWMMKWMLRTFFKSSMINEVPYKQNLPTGKGFLVVDERNFEHEKQRLIALIRSFHARGASYFEGKKHHALKELSANQWNNLLYKHLDHHLSQFGV